MLYSRLPFRFCPSLVMMLSPKPELVEVQKGTTVFSVKSLAVITLFTGHTELLLRAIQRTAGTGGAAVRDDQHSFLAGRGLAVQFIQPARAKQHSGRIAEIVRRMDILLKYVPSIFGYLSLESVGYPC